MWLCGHKVPATMAQSKTNLKELPNLLPHNVDWQAYFCNQNPVDLEIGCGRTHFFFDRATNFPERNVVGVEWKYEFIEQAQRRIVRERVVNAAAFHGNAWLLVPLLFRRESIGKVFVNFPDPWWKSRHKKRLVLNEVFLTALAERMTHDGCIILQTDVEPLFSYYQNLMTSHGAFTFDDTLTPDEISTELQAKTHREKKCLEQGLPIYRGLFRKRSL